MIRAVIVDDEKTSRDTLYKLLLRYCPSVEIAGQAESLKPAIKLIYDSKPDLVFLDIQMPDGSGFKLLEEIGELFFDVIFITAYDQFAIKAFKYSATDYLLKPVVPDELKQAVEKVEQRKSTKDNQNISVLLENSRKQDIPPKKIVLSTAEGMHIVEIDHIIRCESDDYYTKFFLTDDKIIMISRTLKENEELLSVHNFIRPHKSHLINMRYVKSFLRNDGGCILMSDGSLIPVSRRKREKVINMLHNL